MQAHYRAGGSIAVDGAAAEGRRHQHLCRRREGQPAAGLCNLNLILYDSDHQEEHLLCRTPGTFAVDVKDNPQRAGERRKGLLEEILSLKGEFGKSIMKPSIWVAVSSFLIVLSVQKKCLRQTSCCQNDAVANPGWWGSISLFTIQPNREVTYISCRTTRC